jgi:hypothetical protein
MELDHECWAIVAAFLPRHDQRALLALNRSVVDSPVRRQFFQRSVWCVPPTEAQAARVLKTMAMKRSITQLRIRETWQQAYTVDLPVLEQVAIKKMWEPFVLSPWLLDSVKELRLECSHVALSSLNALAENLQKLTLCVPSLTRHRSLKPLPNLRELVLSSASEEKFLWSTNVPNLRVLKITTSEIDARALQPLVHLEELAISHSELPSLSMLRSVASKLVRLSLDHVEFVTPPSSAETSSFVASLIQVTDLDFFDTELTFDTLLPMSKLVRLESLQLIQDDTLDVAPLSTLVKLKTLTMDGDSESDWAPLVNLKELRTLYVNGERSFWNESLAQAVHQLPELDDLQGLFKLSAEYPLMRLTSLGISNASSDLVVIPLGCCPNLHTLEVDGVFDLESIATSFPKLKVLTMDGLEGCTDFRPLARLPLLEELELPSYCRRFEPDAAQSSDEQTNGGYYDFSFLSGMTRMTSLSLRAVPLRDLSVVRRMKQLRFLDITGSDVRDISAVADLHHLQKLHFGGTRAHDLSCLRGHPSIRRLEVPSNADWGSLMTDGGGGGFVLPELVDLVKGDLFLSQ